MNQPYPPVSPAGPRTSTMAIISLIGGIAGWTVVPFLGSIAAIICGHIAKNEIKKSAGTVGGNGMATAGLIMGYLSIALGVCLICVLVILPLLGVSLISIPGIFNTTY
jgi:Domain of unknown function (DUF4190)